MSDWKLSIYGNADNSRGQDLAEKWVKTHTYTATRIYIYMMIIRVKKNWLEFVQSKEEEEEEKEDVGSLPALTQCATALGHWLCHRHRHLRYWLIPSSCPSSSSFFFTSSSHHPPAPHRFLILYRYIFISLVYCLPFFLSLCPTRLPPPAPFSFCIIITHLFFFFSLRTQCLLYFCNFYFLIHCSKNFIRY